MGSDSVRRGLAVEVVAVLEGDGGLVRDHEVLARLLEEQCVPQRDAGERLQARSALSRASEIVLLLVDLDMDRVLGSHRVLLADIAGAFEMADEA